MNLASTASISGEFSGLDLGEATKHAGIIVCLGQFFESCRV